VDKKPLSKHHAMEIYVALNVWLGKLTEVSGWTSEEDSETVESEKTKVYARFEQKHVSKWAENIMHKRLENVYTFLFQIIIWKEKIERS
jgi:hypothetical protein